jgi:pseudooxynicotine oxidase
MLRPREGENVTRQPVDWIKKMSRRRFLGSAATATGSGLALLAAPAALAEQSAGHKPKRATQTDYDVIVIGGGFSGVTAARDCKKNNLRTLLLEAKSRLGGRTFDTQFRGHHIELGGTWVHWTQPAVWAEIERYGIEVEETPGAIPERVVVVNGAERNAFATESRIEEIVAAMTSYFKESALVWERPYDSRYRWKEIEKRDALSAADRLKQIELNPTQRGYLQSVLEAMGHCPVEQSSYVEMLRWYALSLNSWGTAVDALSRYKMPAGTGALARRIAADGGVEVRLNAPVTLVEQRSGVVLVTARGAPAISARAVILALPPRVLKDIKFTPRLSDTKIAASRAAYPTSGIKVYAEVKGRLGKVEWAAASTPGAGLFWTYAELERTTLLVGFLPRADDVDGNDESAVQAALRKFEPDVEVLGCTSYAWGSDPYAQGTYTGFAPGGMTKYFKELALPERLIFMAGGDVGDNGWRNFIDGAITRGAMIAREVSEHLS